MSYEYMNDFNDRADTGRAFLFERVVFADRAAAFRGPEFAQTWRTAAEAVTLTASRFWWAPVRRNLLEFVGAGSDVDLLAEINAVGAEGEDILPSETDVEALEAEEGLVEQGEDSTNYPIHPGKPVITYVSRQEWGRRMLKKADHEELVKELKALEKKYGWEVSPSLRCLGND